MASREQVVLIYDGQCPLCDGYARRLRLREAVGELVLVDARESGVHLAAATAAGLDLDAGMVVMVGEEIYYGADAMHALALMSSRSNLFNRLIFRIFRSPRLARGLYPILRAGRNLLLRLLGRTPVNNLQRPGRTRF